MKGLKKILVTVILIVGALFFATIAVPHSICAESIYIDGFGDETEYNAAEILEDEYNSKTKKIEESLPDYAKEFLDDSGISNGYNWADKLNSQSFLKALKSIITVDVKGVIAAVCGAVGLLLAQSAFCGISPEGMALGRTSSLAVSVSAALCLAVPASLSVVNAVSVIKTAAVVITSFIPIISGVLAALGKTATAAGVPVLVLGMAEVVGMASSAVFSPLVSSHLSLTISSVISGELKTGKIASLIKRVTNWALTLLMSVFVFVLSAQTALQSAADSVTMKTAKFIVGSGVPVVGGAVSEAMSTVTACISMLGTSVWGYTVFAVAAVFLPVIAELLLWRLALLSVSAIAGLLSNSELEAFAEGIDSSVGLVVGMLLCIFSLFVISLSIVVKAGLAV